ncbi:hypothetical protein D3C81_1357540 [compost metagenome]
MLLSKYIIFQMSKSAIKNPFDRTYGRRLYANGNIHTLEQKTFTQMGKTLFVYLKVLNFKKHFVNGV